VIVAVLLLMAVAALVDGDVWQCVGIVMFAAVIVWARAGGPFPRLRLRVSWPGGRWRG
jgi:hypothetical protein